MIEGQRGDSQPTLPINAIDGSRDTYQTLQPFLYFNLDQILAHLLS